MAERFRDRLAHAWNAFNKTDTKVYSSQGPASSRRPDKARFSSGNELSIVNAVYNRISMDVAAVNLDHCKVDENKRYVSKIQSSLSYCLTTEANIDQTSRVLIQDAIMSLFDEGVIAILPTDTKIDPKVSDSYTIQALRVAKIIQWYPQHVRLRCYNERTGYKEEITVPKSTVAIIENPLYAIINEPNSTLKRLISKLNLLDAVDNQSGSGKLDIVIQLPYAIKTDARKQQAEDRRKDIEMQLTNSKYGIAYIDGTEHITQLNRPVDNNLMAQIEYLTSMLYSQLGLTTSVFDGTADDKTMLNYFNRTIEPLVAALCNEMNRKFLSKTARTQNQMILFFQDPFKLVPVSELADIADKFTRNAILSSNEFRSIIGYKPVDDKAANELRNKNLNASGEDGAEQAPVVGGKEKEE